MTTTTNKTNTQHEVTIVNTHKPMAPPGQPPRQANGRTGNTTTPAVTLPQNEGFKLRDPKSGATKFTIASEKPRIWTTDGNSYFDEAGNIYDNKLNPVTEEGNSQYWSSKRTRDTTNAPEEELAFSMSALEATKCPNKGEPQTGPITSPFTFEPAPEWRSLLQEIDDTTDTGGTRKEETAKGVERAILTMAENIANKTPIALAEKTITTIMRYTSKTGNHETTKGKTRSD
jgi:hypothetical protein